MNILLLGLLTLGSFSAFADTRKDYMNLEKNNFSIHKTAFGFVAIPKNAALSFQSVDDFHFEGERRQGRSAFEGGSTAIDPLVVESQKCVSLELQNVDNSLRNAVETSACFTKLMYLKFKWSNLVLNNLYKTRTEEKVVLRAQSQRTIEVRSFRLNSNLEDVFLKTINELLIEKYLITQDFSGDSREDGLKRSKILMNYAKTMYLYMKNKEIFNLGALTAQKKSVIRKTAKAGNTSNLIIPAVKNVIQVLKQTQLSLDATDILDRQTEDQNRRELGLMIEDLKIILAR